jgi:hypothetical protein
LRVTGDIGTQAKYQSRPGIDMGRVDHLQIGRQKMSFELLNKVLAECQKNGFRKFTLSLGKERQ